MRDLLNLIDDLITEASIFTKPKDYTFGHKVNVAAGSEKGQKLLSAIKSQVPDFDENEPLEWVAKAPARSPKIQYGTGDNRRYFKRPNDEYLIIVGPDKSIQQGLIHAKGEKGSTAENKGDASEPVLSAAVVAKLIKRGANNVEDITGNDVKEVLTQALLDPNLSYKVTDQNSRVADTIEFSIKVKKPTMDYLLSEDFWKGYEPFLPSVVHYANSGQMDRYADYFYKNGKADLVRVVSDGVSEATSRKTDIEAYVKDDTGESRKLKGLNVSLKAGSPHIGQVGGGQILKPSAKGYVLSNAQELFGPFGVDIVAPKRINSKVEFWVNAYKQAAKQLAAQLKGADAKNEAGVVYRIANFVTNHATRGDPDIRLVSLGTKGTSSIHSFKNIAQKIADDDIDLTAEYRQGTSKTGDPRPEIRIYDKNSGKPLIYIRYSSTQDETKVWNTVEMKDLLKELTTLKYYKSKPRPANVAPAPTVPVTTKATTIKQPTLAPTMAAPVAEPETVGTTDQTAGGLVDVAGEEEPQGRLTGPGAKTARKPAQPKMTAEVLGREVRRR
jgi:hypothetical protein